MGSKSSFKTDRAQENRGSDRLKFVNEVGWIKLIHQSCKAIFLRLVSTKSTNIS